MSELAQVEPVKKAGFVSSRKTKNQERIEKDEKELQELMANSGEKKVQEGTEEQQDTQAVETGEKTEVQDEALSKEEGSFKKRYGDLRRHMSSKEKEFQTRIESLEGQLAKAAKNELVWPKSESEVDEWTKKHPDVAAIVESIADKKAKQRSQELDARLASVEEMREAAITEKAEAELLKMHPDLKEIEASDDFHDWAENQPEAIQKVIFDTPDAKATASVLQMYKYEKGISNSNKDTDRSAASSVKTTSKTTPTTNQKSKWSESVVEAMSDKEYEKHHEEIMESMRSGTFVYDRQK